MDVMIRGLQVRMSGEEVQERIAERIRLRTENADALDARITARKGDLPFDIRPDDGFETLGELVEARDRQRRRIAGLILLRDRVAPAADLTLGLADLAAADLIDDVSYRACERAAVLSTPTPDPINGLRLTMTGRAVHQLLEERIQFHRERAEWWRGEITRTPEEQTDDEPLLPEHMCEYEAERHEWRCSVLTFIREHLDPGEVYRLGPADLKFGELLPSMPGMVAQAEYEERSRVGFSLERIAKQLSRGDLIRG